LKSKNEELNRDKKDLNTSKMKLQADNLQLIVSKINLGKNKAFRIENH